MCGITGFVVPAGRVGEVEGTLGRMCDAMVHRGPDSEGRFIEPPGAAGRRTEAVVGLGMRRLSILDTATGHQPIYNEDGSVVVVFNGEIYNYPTLKRELESRGHVFRTSADTEVLVHLYEERGEALVEALAGMFTFALYDRRRERLVLGRDRLGIKPLHVLQRGGVVLFASELKSLLAAAPLWPEGFGLELDAGAVEALLSNFYIPGPRTIFQGVRKLPPATTLVLELSSGATHERVYWDLAQTRGERFRDYDAATEALDALLGEVVREHLLSDVPVVGAFVSGGVDSSLVASYAVEHYEGALQTFSIGFVESLYDETADAIEVVRRLQTPHTLQHATAARTAAALPRIFRAMDEPFGDSSMLPTYLVCELAASRLKVALSGDGGDEAFAGYTKYLIEHYKSRLDRVPAAPIQAVQRALRSMPKGGVGRLPELVRKAEKVSRGLVGTSAESYVEMTRLADGELLDSLLVRSGNFADIAASFRARFEAPPEGVSDLARSQYADVGWVLPDDMLTKVDRMSMLCSLEVRVPLLDHRVVEFGYHLPDEYKLAGQTTKRILKRLFCERFERERYSKPKQGFRVPIEGWLQGPLRPLLEYAFEPGRLRRQGVFRAESFAGGRVHELAVQAPHVLWNALMFQVFWSLHIERDETLLDYLGVGV